MNSNEKDPSYSAIRKIGTKGLVIFDRDGTLLRRKSPATDFKLGDVSTQFVEMLKEMRDLDVCFGFIADERGMDARSYGRSEFASLSRVLDQLLRIHSATPDFWISRRAIPRGRRREIRDQHERRQTIDTGLILRAIEWYGVDKSETVFVSNTAAGLLTAHDAGVTGIRYLNLQGDRAFLPRVGTTSREPTSSGALEIERLRHRIQRFLGVGTRGAA